MVSISSRRSALIRFLSRCLATRNWLRVTRRMARILSVPGGMIEPRGGKTMIRLAAVLLVLLFPFAAAFPHDDSDRTDDLLKAVKRARLIDLSHAWTNTS